MIYAVIPTGSRPTEYQAVYDWCVRQGVQPITIATSEQAVGYASGTVLADDRLNISAWWNLGIDYAHAHKAEHIFVLNDDLILPDDWATRIVEALDAGYAGASGTRGDGKITGYAFGLNGRLPIRCDEQLVWWYGDDDIQRQCERAGGFVCLPDLDVVDLYANSTQSRMQAQIDLDRAYYYSKWGL
jgi:glycosyltransferase involved in cell wall biosynthesis